MKFQELITAFKNENDNLIAVLSKPEWERYKIDYNNFIEKQAVLEGEISFQLAKEVCELSKQKFYLYYKDIPHYLTVDKQGDKEPYETVSPLEILRRFGGSYIAKTIANGVSEVMPQKLGDKIEVLASYNITQVGMLAILRTENGALKEQQIISSLDGSREWTVIKEPVMFVDPYTAYIKQEQQKEQGIRQYIIDPMADAGKPIDTEILRMV